jgi:hypothetical protein
MRASSLLLLAACLAACLAQCALACNCVGCSFFSVAVGRPVTISMGSPCASGSYATVSSLIMQSTDGSSFDVRTYNPTDGGQLYPAASFNSVTCLDSPLATNVGASGFSTISVDVTCNNQAGSCPMLQNVQFVCVNGSSVDGGWTAFGTCNSNCQQTRTCTNPAAVGSGANCTGSATQSCSGGSCQPAPSSTGTGTAPAAATTGDNQAGTGSALNNGGTGMGCSLANAVYMFAAMTLLWGLPTLL